MKRGWSETEFLAKTRFLVPLTHYALRIMKKSEFWESIILLLSVVALWPAIWLSKSKQLSEGMLNLYQALLGLILIVLVVIAVRRFRRIRAAMRENKNRRGPFPF